MRKVAYCIAVGITARENVNNTPGAWRSSWIRRMDSFIGAGGMVAYSPATNIFRQAFEPLRRRMLGQSKPFPLFLTDTEHRAVTRPH